MQNNNNILGRKNPKNFLLPKNNKTQFHTHSRAPTQNEQNTNKQPEQNIPKAKKQTDKKRKQKQNKTNKQKIIFLHKSK